jgi:hypothetical protein
MSGSTRGNRVKLSLLPNEELWQIANLKMAAMAQDRLEELTEQQKLTDLTRTEQAELDKLFALAQGIMLKKAEAYRLLSLRGYQVFPQATH